MPQFVQPRHPAGPGSAVGSSAVSSFLDELARLFVSCTIYSPSHPRVTEAAVELLAQLEPLFDARREVSFEVLPDGFRCRSHLTRAAGPLERLHRELERLAIDRITFDRDLMPAHLSQLTACLQEAIQAATQGLWAFDTWAATLPPTVQCRQCDYGTPDFTGDGCTIDPAARETLIQEALRPLRGKDTTPEQHDLTRRFVETLLDTATQASARASRGVSPTQGAENRDQVLTKVVLSVQRILDQRDRRGFDLDQLFDQFHRVFGAFASQSVPDSVIEQLRTTTREVLVESFRRDGSTEAQTARSYRPRRALATDAIQKEVRQFLAAEFDEVQFEPTDRREQLGIAMRMLVEADVRHHPGLVQRVEEILGKGSDLHIEQIGPALGQMCRGSHPGALDGVLAVLARRASAQDQTVLFKLTLALADCDGAHSRQVMWPHLVRAAVFPAVAIEFERRLEVLQRLVGAWQEDDLDHERLVTVLQRVSPSGEDHALPTGVESLYPVFGLILEESRLRHLHPGLFASLCASPPVGPAGQAFRALRQHDLAANRFMVEVLKGFAARRRDAALERRAAQLIATRLERLDLRQRGSAETLELIHALADLPCEVSSTLLRRILRERRAVILKAWPAAARRAASHALSSLDAQTGRAS